VRVHARVTAAILAHAREASPDECCGMLIGDGDQVEDAVRARNIADHPSTRFLVDPRDHLAALREARGRGLDVVGFYHSHPRSAAHPSPTDLAEASYPDLLTAIAGLGVDPPDVRLFRLNERNFLPVEFVTIA
jgi:proteasome lid subunit RPN8/RPN11